MKLLFPIFASLMLQYQVNSEFLAIKKCLMGFGKCKNTCRVDEKEIQKCKKKKCCVGPKVIELIKNYLQHEIPNIPDDNLVEMLKNEKNISVLMQRTLKSPVLSQMKNPNTNSAIIPNDPQGKRSSSSSSSSNTRTPKYTTCTATFSRSITKQSPKPATSSSPPPP
ncbi:beta-defensin 129 [Dipodomys spectabilis]|uniref:beta-defensin 129 n=1 Tax=Dipodomys spectabilis TaxID=105255 RepID=UPI001C544CD4|nr:beta-defensin 129 [Dipodomys spectabilis]